MEKKEGAGSRVSTFTENSALAARSHSFYNGGEDREPKHKPHQFWAFNLADTGTVWGVGGGTVESGVRLVQTDRRWRGHIGGGSRVHSRNIMIDLDIKQVYKRRARRDREQGGIVHDNLPCGGSGSIYLYILS